MRELTILFLHHATDPVTRHHFEILHWLNPGVPVVPLSHRCEDALPGSYDAARLVPEFAGETGWHGLDVMLYAWYRAGRTAETTARRYALVEWDMLWRVPHADFYREVWDADVAGRDVKEPSRHRDWNWFAQMSRLPAALQPFAGGIAPISGLFLADRVLAAISAQVLPLDVFCELRLPTLAKACGFRLTELPPEKCRNLSFEARYVNLEGSSSCDPTATLSVDPPN